MRSSLSLAVLGSLVACVHALSSALNCVSTTSKSGSIPLASSGNVAPLFFAPNEWPAVQRAANDFVTDIRRVTGLTGKLTNVTSTSTLTSQIKNNVPVLIGTLGSSSLIDSVISHAGDAAKPFTAINGSWEAYHAQILSNPLPGVSQAYVIVGADRRGTMFALYELSEQMGVSPWFWWADVPIKQSKSVFLTSTPCAHGSPTVKYRGIFLNDEQPALQNWAAEKFSNNFGGTAGTAVGGDAEFGAMDDPTKAASGTVAGAPFNRFFYTKLFELMLRLKANYLWPAQWGSSFGVDDKLNQFWADYYGIVMGTSHEEPMMRSIPNEWNEFGSGPWDFSANAANITQFWINGTKRAKGFEEIYTVGMRGNGDEPLSEGQDISLLENVVEVQRNIISQVYNITDVTKIPQVWTLYKEVEGFYDDGMRVEDDITLMWTDDNWGNIRRFPLPSERNRTGGSGVYYHVDYVGDPRDYKWIQVMLSF
ncbi:glycoside hydrolase family 115 protein [Sphaerobolus stellatus SS14]|uniref:Glycoside hydrolase family 115 protein n=1 Tax=Sphaerobolus stellatus (strain SS14) TaxID=990650 RepID=A0A0C9VRW8_SPHS4|nr:glycoside hydrolase family 115 protein [Sphaerobolus stellatus SS14]